MAESQAPYHYTDGALEAISRTLSAPRMEKYREVAGHDKVRALQLYLWNCRLAKSLAFPLQIAEVSLRNAISGFLADVARTSDWHNAPALRQQLGPDAEESIDQAISRIRKANKP